MSIPSIFGISKEAADAAAAATSFTLEVPKAPYPVATNTSKNGDLYNRWAEVAVIESAHLETSPKGHTGFVLQGRIRTGNPNQNRYVYARHYINYGVFAQGEEGDKGLKSMNDRSINALTALTRATSFASMDGGLPADLLMALFPSTKEEGANSPLHGKVVTMNLCEGPNKGEGAKSPRSVNVEGYNSAPTE